MKKVLFIAAMLVLGGLALATTWAEEEVTCPLCGAKLKVHKVASYGGYIYNWPSKYRLLFWPRTDPRVLYFCPKCHLSLFMWDFKKLPADKTEELKKALAAAKKEQPDLPYWKIPINYRLQQAEAAYQVLGRDDAFWADFYRLAAYHLEGEKDSAFLERARQQALARTEKLLEAKAKKPTAKENLIAVAGLQYQLGQKEKALLTLKQALATPYDTEEKLSAQERAQGEKYLDELASGLKEVMERGDPLPR